MSTVLTRRPNRRGVGRDRDAGRQASLFGQVVAPPRPAPPRPREEVGTATVAAPPSLDEAMSVLWASLSASAPAACPVCGATMTPRHSAGAGVVGGRCGACGTTVE